MKDCAAPNTTKPSADMVALRSERTNRGPAAIPAQSSAGVAGMNVFHDAKAAILILDADEDASEVLAEALGAAGYSCHICDSAEGARRSVHERAPDLIIADLHLAGHHGALVCDSLRAEEGLSDLPLMFLSTTQVPDVIHRRHEGHGAYYVRKPIDCEVVVELVTRSIVRRHVLSAT